MASANRERWMAVAGVVAGAFSFAHAFALQASPMKEYLSWSNLLLLNLGFGIDAAKLLPIAATTLCGLAAVFLGLRALRGLRKSSQSRGASVIWLAVVLGSLGTTVSLLPGLAVVSQ